MNFRILTSLCWAAVISLWANNVHAEILFADVINGALIVACDDGYDSITIDTHPGSNTIELFWSGNLGDNYQSIGVFSNATNFVLGLGDGDSQVRLLWQSVLGSLDVQAGDGDDTIYLNDCWVGSSTNLDLGNGENTIFTPRAIFGGSLTIETGADNDVINPGTINQVQSEFNGSVRISMGDGRDYCVLADSQCNGDISVTFGNGDNYSRLTGNYIGNVSVHSGGGRDTHYVSGEIGGDIVLVSANGDDNFQLYGCTLQGNLMVESGAGKDFVRLYQQWGEVEIHGSTTIESGPHADDIVISDATLHGTVRIKTAGSNDLVTISDSAFLRALNVDLGSGSDDLIVADSTSQYSTFLYGGSGVDYGSATNSSLGSGRRYTRLSFEQGNL